MHLGRQTPQKVRWWQLGTAGAVMFGVHTKISHSIIISVPLLYIMRLSERSQSFPGWNWSAIQNDPCVTCACFLSVTCINNLFRRLSALLRAIAGTESKCQLISILFTHADHFGLMHMNEQVRPSSVRILRKWFITGQQKGFFSACY